MKNTIDDTHSQYQNSYREAYLWIKGELLDLQGMKDALEGRETVIKAMMATEQKKRNAQLELDKLQAGKKSFKSVLKGAIGKNKDADTLNMTIELAKKEGQSFQALLNFLTIYLGEVAIPKFKKEKISTY